MPRGKKTGTKTAKKKKNNQFKKPGKARSRKKKDKRVCLRCDREFMSDGIYNRICPNCREANANVALYVAESVGDIGTESDHVLPIPPIKG